MSRPTFYVSQDSSDSYDCPPPEIKVSSSTIQDDKDQNTVSSSAQQKCPKHRKHLRRHRLPASTAKTKLEVRSPSVQEIKLEFPKKNQRSKHTKGKSRRSHSITATQPNEIEVLKNWKIQNPDKAVPVGVAGAGLKAEGNTHAADNALPRTLSTSVLRIKHRRTFWERFAR